MLYYYINIRLSLIFGLSSGNIYIHFFRYLFIMLICNGLWITLLCIFWNSISNLITNQITSFLCYFWVTLFEVVLSASVANCLVWSKSFWKYLPLTFLLILLKIFLPIFLVRDRNPQPFTMIWSLGWTE